MTIKEIFENINLKKLSSYTDQITMRVNRPSMKGGVDSVEIGNKKTVSTLMEGDDEPAEFISELKFGEEHPATDFGMKLILTEKWAKSFARGINAQPGLVYLRGHEDVATIKDRAIAAGYVVGAKVEGDSLFLRNYLLPGGNDQQVAEKNQALKELKAGMLSTSTGALTEMEVRENDDGSRDLVALKAVKQLSNALVEYDMTGGEASVTQVSFKGSGIDKKNMDANISKVTTSKESKMTLKEILAALKTEIADGNTTNEKVAAELGLKLENAEDAAALVSFREHEKKAGGDIGAFIEKVESQEAESFTERKNSALKERLKDHSEGVLKVATDLFSLKTGSEEDIKNEIERVCGLDSIKTLTAQKAGDISHGFGSGEEKAEATRDHIDA